MNAAVPMPCMQAKSPPTSDGHEEWETASESSKKSDHADGDVPQRHSNTKDARQQRGGSGRGGGSASSRGGSQSVRGGARQGGGQRRNNYTNGA